MRHTLKRLLAILTGIAGLPLLIITRAADDPVIRVLAGVAGICLIISGSMQFWLMRARKRRASGDDIPY